ncbi:hypothetical protein BATDEDRAFT_85815 [Batrachochytrium dendrobatidis JAM81]|uniref:Uncharacterized protein n=2 Tax=Batrachochytrium dendrobatidis TaxID=109871 RepID=F4NUY1_BATDJ|nr:uncharacterized protein BATDEDRAFT_85815 [Batrachochytrium dendrobatidis JAM81]EGF83224.1 hypothetical protein BATDEDRAFT_85815 [Batrachochytrium dendrobatidis JAM81]KAK5671384.1 hypothetical protein QVD99_002100 [Batrachochytrium dendrobatidis]OAJ36495.1 hypothetical protein BDEG_20660 [Batrachochytrium dendrobatidis JEL423]|eukprot:XP_006676022.1 hypothetical protein BATDEDRAFT_85815 [Batrachochytrium dendrobatidis JAM81]
MLFAYFTLAVLISPTFSTVLSYSCNGKSCSSHDDCNNYHIERKKYCDYIHDIGGSIHGSCISKISQDCNACITGVDQSGWYCWSTSDYDRNWWFGRRRCHRGRRENGDQDNDGHGDNDNDGDDDDDGHGDNDGYGHGDNDGYGHGDNDGYGYSPATPAV